MRHANPSPVPRLLRADEARQDDPAYRGPAGTLRVLLLALQAGGNQNSGEGRKSARSFDLSPGSTATTLCVTNAVIPAGSGDGIKSRLPESVDHLYGPSKGTANPSSERP